MGRFVFAVAVRAFIALGPRFHCAVLALLFPVSQWALYRGAYLLGPDGGGAVVLALGVPIAWRFWCRTVFASYPDGLVVLALRFWLIPASFWWLAIAGVQQWVLEPYTAAFFAANAAVGALAVTRIAGSILFARFHTE